MAFGEHDRQGEVDGFALALDDGLDRGPDLPGDTGHVTEPGSGAASHTHCHELSAHSVISPRSNVGLLTPMARSLHYPSFAGVTDSTAFAARPSRRPPKRAPKIAAGAPFPSAAKITEDRRAVGSRAPLRAPRHTVEEAPAPTSPHRP
ncbi:hypothetical protein GCM10022221_15230 [Actinocorallia aurea]